MNDFYENKANEPSGVIVSHSAQLEESPTEPVQEGTSAPKSLWKKFKAWLAPIGVVLLKIKSILILIAMKLKFLLVALKFLKFGKVLLTMGSMLFTIVIDAQLFGWPFAVGFVLLIFVHEMGHVLMIRAKGIDAGAPVFIPFVGAFIALKEMPLDAKDEAHIGIAGPLLGSVGALVCYAIGMLTGSLLMLRLAYLGFFLNLFNLMPIIPLDGGRVMAAVSPKVWVAGLVMMVVYFLFHHNPIILIIVLLSAGRVWHTLHMKPEELPYYNVSRETRVQMAVAYFGLAFFLGYMMMQLHTGRPVEHYRDRTVVTSAPRSEYFSPNIYGNDR